MRPTRKGLIGAASYLGVVVGVAAFVATLAAGETVLRAFFLGSLCGVPFVLLEQVFGFPELWRWARANWKPMLAMEVVALTLAYGWKSYTRAVGMTRAERLHATLAVSWVLPLVAFVGIVFAYRRGFFRAADRGPS